MLDLWLPGTTIVRAVAGPDVRQRHQDDDLAAMELAGVVPVLRADRPDVAAGMHPLGAALRRIVPKHSSMNSRPWWLSKFSGSSDPTKWATLLNQAGWSMSFSQTGPAS